MAILLVFIVADPVGNVYVFMCVRVCVCTRARTHTRMRALMNVCNHE